jgi:phage gpG-like protein
MQAEVNLTGLTTMSGRLESLAAAAGSLQMYAFPAIAADFHRIEEARFSSEGNGTWKALQPSTVRIKERKGQPRPRKIMYGWGDLQASLTGFAKGTVYEDDPAGLFVGTSIPYAHYHQVGPREIRVFGRGRAILPQRRLVALGPDDAHRWAEILQAALTRGRL